MRPINIKKDSWILVDNKGQVYEYSRRKAYLLANLNNFRRKYFKRELQIKKNF